MNRIFAALLLSQCFGAAFAGDASGYKSLDLPKAPPVVRETLPGNAQPTDRGVMVPLDKTGTWNVHVEKLPNARAGEAGGVIGFTYKTK